MRALRNDLLLAEVVMVGFFHPIALPPRSMTAILEDVLRDVTLFPSQAAGCTIFR
jgi:hypothetical protein